MKKTLTINLNKTVFHIDEDAYELLQAYLSDVSHHLKSETERTEIISDIEARIAELFTERLGKTNNVVTLEEVNAIIAIMGKPSQFTEEEEENENKETNEQAEEKTTYSGSKRFYRDTENALLGGVCSGLAAYLGWDVTLIRIMFLVLVLIGLGSLIPVYLVIWLIAPRAISTAQKMEMRGEIVNIETIKNKFNETKNYLESDKFKESATEVGSGLINLTKNLFKVIATIVGVLLSVAGVIIAGALIFGLVIFLFQPETITNIFPDFSRLIEGISQDKIAMLVMGLLFIIGCPIFSLIYWSMRTTSKDKAVSNTPFWVALILWLAGIFMFASIGSETFKIFNQNIQKFDNWDINNDSGNPDWTSEIRHITEPFYAVDASGVMNVELTYQPERKVEVATVNKYLSKIKTEVKDGVLKIYSTDLLIKPKIKISIGTDSLTGIYAQGAAKIMFTNAFPSKNFKAELDGASKSYLNLSNAQNVNITLSGASKLEMEGIADTLRLESSGASNIDSESLKAKYVKLDLSGITTVDLNVSETIEGDISGASSVNCAGNPRKKEVSMSGTAKINYEE